MLSHFPRASITMQRGTTLHFVTGGIQAALECATKAAAGKDIQLGGGVAAIQQQLRAQLFDELQLAISPALLSSVP